MISLFDKKSLKLELEKESGSDLLSKSLIECILEICRSSCRDRAECPHGVFVCVSIGLLWVFNSRAPHRFGSKVCLAVESGSKVSLKSWSESIYHRKSVSVSDHRPGSESSSHSGSGSHLEIMVQNHSNVHRLGQCRIGF